MSTRDKFLSRAKTFELDKFGDVWLRPMSKGAKSRMEAIASKETKTAKDCSDIRWIALQWCVCDEQGEPILSNDDRANFDGWDDSFIEPMFERILEISKVTEKDREEFEKN